MLSFELMHLHSTLEPDHQMFELKLLHVYPVSHLLRRSFPLLVLIMRNENRKFISCNFSHTETTVVVLHCVNKNKTEFKEQTNVKWIFFYLILIAMIGRSEIQ